MCDVKLTVKKADNPMNLKNNEKSFSIKKNLNKNQTFSIGVNKAQGNVLFTLDKKAKKAKIKVSEKGSVTIPKKCKIGCSIDRLSVPDPNSP